MTPAETVTLTRYVKACCPGEPIDEFTADAWHDLLGDLELTDCRAAVIAAAQRQPFVAPADIRAEVKRIRRERLERTPLPAPDPELTGQPAEYRKVIAAETKRIADGWDARRAIGSGRPREDPPPAEFQRARAALGPAPAAPARELTPQEIARRQAAQSRAARAGQQDDAP